MRINIKLSKNQSIIPFNYQQKLVGVINKWIGQNNFEHGKTSNFSFSWLLNTSANAKGINLTPNSFLFISAHNEDLIKQIIKGILKNPDLFLGVRVVDVQIVSNPNFNQVHRFSLANPILLRERDGDKIKHVLFSDEQFDSLLTSNLKKKLQKNNLESNSIKVYKDRSYHNPKTKLINYNGVENKSSMIPIIIEGTKEQIEFAWNVGLGESTGIGFGALK